MSVEIFSDPQSFNHLNSDWQSLLTRSGSHHFFLSPLFQGLWWQHFGRGELRLIALRDINRKLVALAPLAYDAGTLSLLGGEEIADYLDFIVDRENEEENYRKLWEEIMGQEWKRLRLLPLPSSSPTLHYLPILAGQKKLIIHKEIKKETFLINLPNSFEAYLTELSRKARHEIRRKTGRLEKSGRVEIYQTKNFQALPGDLDTFFLLHRKSHHDKAQFMNRAMEKFFRNLAEGLLKEEKLSLAFLLLNGSRIAVEFSFIWEGSLLLYNSGYDPAYAALSPGFVLASYLIRTAIENGYHYFDFLQGPERYKRDLGGRQDFVYTLEISREP